MIYRNKNESLWSCIYFDGREIYLENNLLYKLQIVLGRRDTHRTTIIDNMQGVTRNLQIK